MDVKFQGPAKEIIFCDTIIIIVLYHYVCSLLPQGVYKGPVISTSVNFQNHSSWIYG